MSCQLTQSTKQHGPRPPWAKLLKLDIESIASHFGFTNLSRADRSFSRNLETTCWRPIRVLPVSAPFWYHYGMAMTLRLPPEIEDQLKQVADIEHRSVQQTVLVAIEEYLSMRETTEILADPAALRGLAEARESEQAGDVVYGTEAARALLAERKR
jgi:predicted transcriptional regulator